MEERRITAREEILSRYRKAKQANPDLTQGEFMMLSNPDYYTDEASAARAFRKIASGESSGARLYQRSGFIGHYKRVRRVKGKNEYQRVYEKRRGGYEYGLWKVILTVEFIDPDTGEPVQEEASYIIRSDLDSNYDLPYIYSQTTEWDDNYLTYWADVLYHWPDAQIVGKEIVRIERTNAPMNRSVTVE